MNICFTKMRVSCQVGIQRETAAVRPAGLAMEEEEEEDGRSLVLLLLVLPGLQHSNAALRCTIFYGDEMNMLASAYEKGRDERMEEGASHCNALMLT